MAALRALATASSAASRTTALHSASGRSPACIPSFAAAGCSRFPSQQQQQQQRRAAHRIARQGPGDSDSLLLLRSARARCNAQQTLPPNSLRSLHERLRLPQRSTFHGTHTRLRPAQGKPGPQDEATRSGTAAGEGKPKALSENIYTIPNLLTMSRLITCPIIGWQVLEGNMKTATFLLFFSALTDLLDGYLARRMNSYTVFGSIADPAADKALMTVMVITLGIKGLIPPLLAALIIGRDVGLVLTAFYIRYASLPPPKTFARYWDFSLPSASVQPTQISKYNTFLQLCLVGLSTVLPILSPETQELCAPAMTAFQWIVAGTTIWSGASYVFGRGAVTYLARKS